MSSLADFQTILNALEFDLPCRVERQRCVISADQWVLASGLQKAIRRGDAAKAAAFAHALWTADRRMFWRRLHVTALEDVGAADAEAVVKVLAAYSCPSWRQEQGDKAVAVHLAQLLAKATKSRLADEILMYLEAASELAPWRKKLAKASAMRLGIAVLESELPFPVRAMALQLLAGTRQFPSKQLPKKPGSLDMAARVLRKLGGPHMLTEACIAVMDRTQWPLALFVPLAHQWVQKEAGLHVTEHTMQGMPSPVSTDLVRMTMRGIRRVHGRPQQQVAPLVKEDLIVALAAIPDDLRGLRDKAVLLVGFCSALRRSEICQIHFEHLEFTSEGLVLTVPRSKTDQTGQGRRVGIPYPRLAMKTFT